MAAGVVDLVLVGVKITCGGLPGDGLRDVQQGIVRQPIIVVEQGDEFAGGHRERGIGGPGDVAVLRAEDRFDTRIGLGRGFEHAADVRLGGGVVGDAQFPARINLLLQAGEEFAEVFFRRVVSRHNDADERATGFEQSLGVLLQDGAEARREPVMPAPPGVGILVLAANDGLRDFIRLSVAQRGGEVFPQPGDGGAGFRPAVELVASEQPAAQEGGNHLAEEPGPEDGDGAGVFIAPVEIQPAGKSQGTDSSGGLGQDEQVGRTRGIFADVHQAVITGLERIGVIAAVAGDIGPVLGIDEAVLREDTRGGAKPGEVVPEAKDPARDAKFFVADIDPEPRVLDVSEEIIADADIAGRGEDIAEDRVRLAAEFAPAAAMEMAVKVVKGLLHHRGAEAARRFDGVGRQGRGVERGVEKFPPLDAVVPVEGEFPGPAPDLDTLREAGVQRGGRGPKGLGQVGSFQAVDAEINPAVHPRAQVGAPRGLAGMEPTGDLQRSRRGPPVRGTVDMMERRGRGGHAKGWKVSVG